MPVFGSPPIQEGQGGAEASRFFRAPASTWTSSNPVLGLGEIGQETDTGLYKIGDSVSTWNVLTYQILTGPQGPQGVPGNDGAQGIQGVSGNDGVPGGQGIQGIQGIQGPAGADSTVPGPQGTQGIQGIQGDAGAQGIQGIPGADSIVPGPQGIQGLPGDAGSQGIQGIQGIQGVPGNAGPQGIQGIVTQLVVPIAIPVLAALAWTNQPAALSFWLSTATVAKGTQRVNLTGYTQVRLLVNKQGTAGAAAAKLILRYKAAPWTQVVANYSDIGVSEVSVAINVQNTFLDTGWINLAAGANADVFIDLLGQGGDGVLDPAFGYVCAVFK
jgi:hypothetical protein